MPRSKRLTKPLKKIPKFVTEAAEQEFWATHDTTEYFDWSKARDAVFPDLHPSTETISLRLPAPLLADLKTLANERDVPCQSLMKVFLADQVRRERANAGLVRERKRAPAKTLSRKRD